MTGRSNMKLGVNGFGRIGKLTVWHHVGRRYFKEIVVNLGREAGTSFKDIVHYIERDSTYGFLDNYLHGYNAQPAISEVNDQDKTMIINDVKVKFLLSDRNPADIAWKENDVRIAVDTTGQFLDPTLSEDHAKGSARGHLKAGAEKIIVSAPFKIKDKGHPMPEDAVTTVMGINDHDYDPRRHRVISNASCTTTCLAHMMKPLLNMFGSKKILSASMSTIHAATGSQAVLDRLPGSGAGDLRKNRSIMNNIILTSTGAAKALRLVIPEMEEIGFIAESVRIPTSTGSLVILVVNFQDEISGDSIRRETINNVYRQAAADDPNKYLHFTEKQNVSGDIIGTPRAAAVIEGHETHTRTAEVTMDIGSIPGLPASVKASLKDTIVRVPITQAVIYGWYDNEMGSYVNMLGDRTVTIAENL
ncbi:Glyceraldehyde-3-phosphate dehydrogenase [Desulfonema limicola]|uniref:Glyceraldehyde-3-phosphate dehydrogenase n=1 Tax=Desulfonema limicola TaxID=45656 RepID=A0A975BBE3_9BACT|nr:glyceraldehyde 3-phosphate dehydrogenase NAD-binding domain-containing protein [Desulfonema limicola]QTA82564.1 Glyceraldehyde-3-phosphate dehydrogenase [Desulfonema limicola]